MKLMGKAVRRGAAVLIFAAALAAAAYHFSYPIELNMTTLPEEVASFLNRESEDWDPSEITVYGGVRLGDREYYLMEMGKCLGSAALRRSLTGRYKIEYLRYGGGGLRDSIVESGGKKYLLLGGRDQSAKPKDHFLLCAEVDSRIEDSHIDKDRVTFYDEAGEDITGLYDLSGGGI